MGHKSITRSPAALNSLDTSLYTWVRERPQPGLKPRPLDPRTSALTTNYHYSMIRKRKNNYM